MLHQYAVIVKKKKKKLVASTSAHLKDWIGRGTEKSKIIILSTLSHLKQLATKQHSTFNQINFQQTVKKFNKTLDEEDTLFKGQ